MAQLLLQDIVFIQQNNLGTTGSYPLTPTTSSTVSPFTAYPHGSKPFQCQFNHSDCQANCYHCAIKVCNEREFWQTTQ